jgi:hypothetical protein
MPGNRQGSMCKRVLVMISFGFHLEKLGKEDIRGFLEENKMAESMIGSLKGWMELLIVMENGRRVESVIVGDDKKV